MGFCGNLKVAICGNFEYPKIASVEGFELFSCLTKCGDQWECECIGPLNLNVPVWIFFNV